MPTCDANAILSASREFAALLKQVADGPVEPVRDGGGAYVLMRADHFVWMKMAARRGHRTMDADPVIIEAVENAKLEPVHTDVD